MALQPSKPAGVFMQLMSLPTMATGFILALGIMEWRWGSFILGIIIMWSGVNMLTMGGRPARRNR